jgi:putative tryptophan/tyrosine transport system substrate-binding protein
MDRRAFLAGSLALLAAPRAAEAQQTGKLYRVGILSPGGVPGPAVATTPNLVPRNLHALGYVNGRNLVVERRFADGQMERLPSLARDLLRLPVDVIVIAGGEATHAAREVTATAYRHDRRRRSCRQGMGEEPLTTRRECDRRHRRRRDRAGRQATAAELRVKLVVVEVQGRDYDRAFTTMITERSDAVFVLMSPVLTRDRKDIIERAAKHRLPAIYEWRECVEVGGLMSYGGSIIDLTRRVAVYVDKILRGATPGDLPVEQPTKFELVVNLKTAKALGLTIPQSVLARADKVIQ